MLGFTFPYLAEVVKPEKITYEEAVQTGVLEQKPTKDGQTALKTV